MVDSGFQFAGIGHPAERIGVLQPAPKISPDRKPQFGQLWDDVADNQRHLADCELRFVVELCRRGWTAQISGQSWKEKTGRNEKMMQRAIRGLRDKGLDVSGEGKAARYTWDRQKWAAYTHSARPQELKARTAGRSATAKPGQQIHAICRDRGCQKLCEPKETPCEVISITSAVSTNVGTPVSTIVSNYPKAQAAIEALFPRSTDDMAQQVADACKGQNFTDEQLASAIYSAKTKNQKTAGLFTHTVPKVLKAQLAAPKLPGTRQVSPADSIRAYLTRTAEALRTQNLFELARRIEALDPASDIDELEEALQEIEPDALAQLRPPPNLAEIVKAELKPFRGKMSQAQLNNLEGVIRRRETFKLAGIEGFSVTYAL